MQVQKGLLSKEMLVHSRVHLGVRFPRMCQKNSRIDDRGTQK